MTSSTPSVASQFNDWIRHVDPTIFGRLAEALAEPPTVAIRFNAGKGMTPPVDADIVPWCPQGEYLSERPEFTFDPRMHQGLYYVQEASSMFLHHVLSHLTAESGPVGYLDACAAPGGKTTVALDTLPKGSVVTANEFIHTRCDILRENLAKWGNPMYAVHNTDTRFYSDGHQLFDIILCDAPCSGEGMMRKDPQAVEQWSPQLVEQCAVRQREIIANLWSALRPGGYLIYSTCTFNRIEDEEMVHHIIDTYGAESVEIPTPAAWGIIPGIDTTACCYRFVPPHTRGEGLFMAVLRKPIDAETSEPKRSKRLDKDRRQAKKIAVPSEAKSFLKADTKGAFEVDDRQNILFHPDTSHLPGHACTPLLMGTLKGRDIIPSQQLALSTLLRPEAFPTVEVDLPTAIRYLRCETIELPSSAPRGIVLLTFNGRPLAFAKNIGSRANNLYPKPWRIRSDFK